LFDDAPKALIDKVEQVARLIRSKGVGVYFITQNPDDVPDAILGQLGNRFQHALRAFTARDQKALKRAAETYRPNPRFDTVEAIRDVGTGEAVTSLLEGKGVPGVVERTLIRPPATRLGPCDAATRRAVIATSPVAGKYEAALDRRSAFEMLAAKAEAAAKEAEEAEARAAAEKTAEEEAAREFKAARRYSGGASPGRTTRGRATESLGGAITSAVVKELQGTTGRRLVRGILGGLFRGR
jgi:DNA helicase HerA-like ATPase